MNIGNIVSTVQSEPLEEAMLEPGELIIPLRIIEEMNKSTWEVLVNDEITPEVREDVFA